MSILKEIHNQPLKVRRTMFVLAVVATVAIVGRVWLDATRESMYAMVNPSEQNEEINLAEDDSKSFITVLGESFSSLKALMSDAFDGSSDTKIINDSNDLVEEDYIPLPISREK